MGLALVLGILIAVLGAGVSGVLGARADSRFAPRRGTARQRARLVLLLSLAGGVLFPIALAITEPLVFDARLRASLEAAESPLPAVMRTARAEALATSETELRYDDTDAFVVAALSIRKQRALRPWRLSGAALLGCLLGFLAAFALGRANAHPRRAGDAVVGFGLRLAAAAAMATTLGIVLSLVFETARFLTIVPLHEFLFGLRWEPQIALRADQVAGSGAFGVIPVLAGTILISAIAVLLAGPIGILAAVWLSEYASPRLRTTTKPILELLAGIPTVVYGFFAVVALAPLFREAGAGVGITLSPNSALVAGVVMGVMILPFVSSLTDDALYAVPRSLRFGALALGATRLEMVWGAVLPAALPGIVSAFLLAISRALGETMIVVMAAGLIARLTANPLDSVTTVTVQIVVLLTGDTAFDNPKTLSAFALGLTLLLLTLCLNLAAWRFTRMWRRTHG